MSAMKTRHDAETSSISLSKAAVWSAQAILVAVFAFAGISKLAFPSDQLERAMGLSAGLLRFIGLTELSGAVALDPLVSHFWPRLSAFAAAGLTVVMLLAASYHLGRGETAMIPVNVLLATLAAFVAWHRFGRQG